MLYVSGFNSEKALYAVTDTDDGKTTWLSKADLYKAHEETVKVDCPIRGVEPDRVRVLKLKSKPSFQENMKKWIMKAKFHGIYDHFRFDNDFTRLVSYDGSSSTIVVPPVKVIGPSCFAHDTLYDCEHKFVIPDSVEVISDGAFKRVWIAEGSTFNFQNVRVIDRIAFKWSKCKSRISLNLPSCVEVLEEALAECEWLESVSFGDSLKVVDNSAFLRCKSLKHVDLGNTVEKIAKYAFGQCNSLYDVFVPESVKTLGTKAFWVDMETLFDAKTPYSITFGGDVECEGCAEGRTEFRL